MATGAKRISFSTQWIILSAGLALLAGAAVLHLSLEHRRVEDREHEKLLTQARVIARNLEANFASVNQVLEDLRRDHPGHRSARDLRHDMKTLTDAMPGVRTLTLVDAEGRVVASSRPELEGRNFAHREYFSVPRRNPGARVLFVSAPFKTTLGVNGIALSRAILGPGDQFSGVIVATLDPEYFKTLMASVLYAPDMETSIAHAEGLLFMAQPDRKGSAGNAFDGGETERIIAQDSAHSANQDKPLVVTVSRRRDAVFEPWHRDVRVEGAVVLMIALLAAGTLSVHQRRYAELMRKEADALAALSNSERFMRVLTDNLPGMVGYWTADLRCRFANQAYLEWFGKTPEQMHGILIQDLMGEELFRKNEPYMRAALRGERQNFERTLVKADGSTGYTWASYIPDVDGGQVKGFYVLVADVTQLKQAQFALAQSEHKLKSIIEAEPECVKVLALDGTLLQMNRAGLDMLEVDSEEEVLGNNIVDCVGPEYREAFADLNRRVCQGGSGSLEFEICGRKGGRRWVDMRAVPMRDADGRITGVLSVTRDISARKKAEGELEAAARTDFLTGLANRRRFLQQAEQELSRSLRYGGPLSVFMLDLDHFKGINDAHGHQVGDQVLLTLGSVCRAALRDIDIVGRLGGEEFGVVLPQTDYQSALEAAERLRKAIAEADVPLEHGLPLRFTASIGVATLTDRSTNLDTLLSQADAALYRAKNDGRNCVRGIGEVVSPPSGATAK
ncbi:MAG: diguanylate cyclase [Ignavibacteria bacterium]